MVRREQSRRRVRLRALIVSVVLAAAALLALAISALAQTDSTAKVFPGTPLTVDIGPRGECQSSYLVNGEVAGNFYLGSNQVGDCGFFLAFPGKGTGQPEALKKTTWGFDGLAGPQGLSTYTPISQSEVTGAGTTASPYTQTTVFAVEAEEAAKPVKFAEITEVTTYINGAPQFESTFTVKNLSKTNKIYFRAMYAGDLYVNGNDHGIGIVTATSPRFIGGQNTGSGVIGGFQEVTGPGVLPWSSFQEAYWSTAFEGGEFSTGDNGIWHDVETMVEEPKAFNETIEPKELDNAAGVEWDQLRETGLAPEASQSFSIISRTQIPNELQFTPATQTLTQGQTASVAVTATDNAGQPYAGRALRYTVTGANPQSGAVTLNGAGQATISYVGTNAGADVVNMYVDLGGTGSQTPSDPHGTATISWLPKPPAPNSTYVIQKIKANSNGTITITFVPAQGGTATVEVTVPTATISRVVAEEAKKKRCKKGQIKIKGKCRPVNTLSGKVSATGIAGVPLTITIKPSSKVKAALKKGRTVRLTVTLRYQSALGGPPTVTTKTVTIKPPKKKKH